MILFYNSVYNHQWLTKARFVGENLEFSHCIHMRLNPIQWKAGVDFSSKQSPSLKSVVDCYIINQDARLLSYSKSDIHLSDHTSSYVIVNILKALYSNYTYMHPTDVCINLIEPKSKWTIIYLAGLYCSISYISHALLSNYVEMLRLINFVM